ncbi:lysophospholipid acyltransferase family protein [Mycoplasmatota bacterium WC44]
MKRSFKGRVSNFSLKALKPLVTLWMKIDTKTTVTKDYNVEFKRDEPFVLLANHVYTFDVVQLALPFKKTPVIVASHLLLTTQPLKFLLKYVAKCIPKSKGEADIRTAKELIKAIKRKKPVMIMPEGDSTFFGETGHIEYSTAKLIKKLKVDVIVGLFKGGYLAKPRWAIGKRKNRRVELHYSIAITKDEIKELTVDEIYDILCTKLFNNDYVWQRDKMINYGGKDLAEGLSNILYTCPECEGLNSLETIGNLIKCTECNTEGYMDDFGFIQGFKLDNIYDWNNYQKEFTDKLKVSTFSTSGELQYVYLKEQCRRKLGIVNVEYDGGKIYLTGAVEKKINLEDMLFPVITMRRNFTFEYEDTFYFIKLDNYAMSFLRVCQDKY